ncbi:MAG TPA: CPBP family glutamic-type intramembrane protease [Candidatus Xenobia bacterium]|jgi:hypothetical protein
MVGTGDAAPVPSKGPRPLLILSVVFFVLIVGGRFFSVGQARQERGMPGNPMRTNAAGKLLVLNEYLRALTQSPGLGPVAQAGLLDQLQPEAAQMLKEALEESPHDWTIQCKLAIVQAERGKTDEVKSLLDRAATDAPKDSPAVGALRLVLLPAADPQQLSSPKTTAGLLDVWGGHGGKWFVDTALILRLHQQYPGPVTDGEKQLRQEMRAEGQSAFYIIGGGAAAILMALTLGSLLLIAAPFIHKFANLRTPDENGEWDWTRGWMAFVLFMLLDVVIGVGYGFLVRGSATSYSIPAVLMVQALVYASSLVGVYLLLRGQAGIQLAMLGVHTRRLGRCLVIGVVTYLCCVPCIVVAGLALQVVLKHVPSSENGVFAFFQHPPTGLVLVGFFLLVCVVGPLFEEFMFRGVLYSSLRKAMRPSWAIVLSAFIFGIVHADLPGLLPIFVLACFMGLIYEKSGSLVPSIVMHMLQNTMTFVVMMFLAS